MSKSVRRRVVRVIVVIAFSLFMVVSSAAESANAATCSTAVVVSLYSATIAANSNGDLYVNTVASVDVATSARVNYDDYDLGAEDSWTVGLVEDNPSGGYEYYFDYDRNVPAAAEITVSVAHCSS